MDRWRGSSSPEFYPVTIDDLTGGFNIAQIITLKRPTLNMMGFTQAEVDAYVGEIFAENEWPDSLRRRVLEDLRAHYNGYRLQPDTTETLYNSTICNFYLSGLVIGKGEVPRELIDDNLRVDVNWLRLLTGSEEGARALVEQLMFEGSLPADMDMLSSKFNMQRFFQPEYFPLSLYYLGMVTFQSEYSLGFPNLSVKKIYTEYFNELQEIVVSLGYQKMFEQFLRDHDWAALFAGYWETYVGQIPAQAFDKVNESFFRHYARAEGERAGVLRLPEALPEDAAQVERYAAELHRLHPELTIRRYVAYTVSGGGGRLVATGAAL